MPYFRGEVTQAKSATARDHLHNLRGAIELYAATWTIDQPPDVILPVEPPICLSASDIPAILLLCPNY